MLWEVPYVFETVSWDILQRMSKTSISDITIESIKVDRCIGDLSNAFYDKEEDIFLSSITDATTSLYDLNDKFLWILQLKLGTDRYKPMFIEVILETSALLEKVATEMCNSDALDLNSKSELFNLTSSITNQYAIFLNNSAKIILNSI